MGTKQPIRSSADAKYQSNTSCLEFVTNRPEKSTLRKGTTVHRVIREQLSAYFAPRYGPRISVKIPAGSYEHYRDKNGIIIGGDGEVDLAFKSMGGSVMLVAEVKPANKEGLYGRIQLEHYIDKANSDEDLKKKYGVRVFSPMLPDRFNLLPPIIAEGKYYEIRWCDSGLLLYKEVPKDKDEDKKEKKHTYKKETQQSFKEQVKEQRSTSAKERGTSVPRQIEILRAAPRFEPPPSWMPERLQRDIDAGTLADGLYRDRYSARFSSGYSTNVVVWVKTNPLGKEHQYYQEFPEDPSFYDKFARMNGLSARQADLIRRTMTDYNRDLWSLIAPDPKTGLPSSRSPEYARAELRAIYGEILWRTFEASANIVGAGAGITGVSNAMRQRGTTQTGVPPDRKLVTPGEPPLPDWVSKSVKKGADLFREIEKQMRVTP
jgi:hypothetical protein